MSSSPIDGMAGLLAQAWALRSPDEQSGFVSRMTADLGLPAADTLRKVRERGALSGAVAPRDLVRGLARVDADRLLDNVLVDFDRALVDGDWAWTLRNGPRRQVLARLAATGTVHQALEDVAGIGTDAVGEALRELVRTGEQRAAIQKVDPEKRNRVVLQALAWAAPLGGHAGELAEARRRASIASVRDSYQTLLREGFHGRTRELTRLRKFAEAPVHPSRPVPFFPVTGIGGSGKSTLLAALIGPYLERLADGDPTAPAIIVIDFDRVHFRVNAELELSFEVTRQLGCSAPVALADFSVLRHQTRQERQHTGVDVAQGYHNVEGTVRSASGFDLEAGTLVRMHDLEHRPVLLVLDTFEEWQRDRPLGDLARDRWNDPEQRILDWIWRLRHEMRLRGLRVIASGRAGVARTEGVQAVHPLPLGDLDRASATKLLGAMGVTGSPATALLRAVGGNPLSLRVAARFYRRLSTVERRRFASELRSGSPTLDHDLRRAVLYDRFLDHIGDPSVRALAHPGLALRRVTPSLVRHVLAIPCGLGEIDDPTAERLTEKLADEVWLVRPTPDGLRHQPDVRRAMLHMMSTDPDHSDTIRTIHQAAADWYVAGRDPDLSYDAAQLEWFYHKLMQEPGDRSIMLLYRGIRSSNSLAAALGTAVSDLHPSVSAQVRALRGEELHDAEAQALPSDVWAEWFGQQGDRLVKGHDSSRALRLFRGRLISHQDVEEPDWLAQAYCETARWSEYWKTLKEPGLLNRGVLSDIRRSGRYAYLNALCSLDPRNLDLYDHHLTGLLGRAWSELIPAQPGAAGERVFFGLLRTMTSTVVRELPREWRRVDTREVDFYPVDQLRRLVFWASAARPRQMFVLHRTAGLFQPNPRWITAWTQTVDVPGYDRGLYSLDLPGQGLNRSDEVLGEMSSRFARRWPTAELTRDRLVNSVDPIRLLRGDNPELRPAIRLAVSAVAERHGLGTLAEVALGVLPIPVSDLHPDAVHTAGPAQSQKLAVQLVEYVDRSGVMRDFLVRAGEAYPDVELVGRVEAAFAVWDDTYNSLLRSVFRPK